MRDRIKGHIKDIRHQVRMLPLARVISTLGCATALLGGIALSMPVALAGTSGLAALGERIFFDVRLSADGKTSCGSCHQPERAFTDGLTTSRGTGGRTGSRNAPSLLDVERHGELFWDGRQATLLQQALEPFTNPLEHGLRDHEELLTHISADPAYPSLFAKAFGVDANPITAIHVASALAAFQSTLRTGDAPIDRFLKGDRDALDEGQRRGLELFRGRAHCADCHRVQGASPIFTDNAYHGLGIGDPARHARLAELTREVVSAPKGQLAALIVARPDIAALGRFVVTQQPSDIGRFKTPSLRNVAVTAPYMHDGSVSSVEEAVEREIYYRSHTRGAPTILTPQEKSDLVAFLRALTSDRFGNPALRPGRAERPPGA